jgi:hypothetical protein
LHHRGARRAVPPRPGPDPETIDHREKRLRDRARDFRVAPPEIFPKKNFPTLWQRPKAETPLHSCATAGQSRGCGDNRKFVAFRAKQQNLKIGALIKRGRVN